MGVRRLQWAEETYCCVIPGRAVKEKEVLTLERGGGGGKKKRGVFNNLDWERSRNGEDIKWRYG